MTGSGKFGSATDNFKYTKEYIKRTGAEIIDVEGCKNVLYPV
jgi:hypothetical protein